jgi:Zinc dependent phospholipase C
MNRRRCRALSATLLLALLLAPQGHAYSFLTHESIIDLAWEPAIRPVLLARFPNTTPAQLKIAHGYAYGGSAIQDAGYYPFGHEFFSDLTHYVRTGAFITNLIHDARDVNELAFALGALSHYVGDSIGHRYATNPATAVEFPSLEAKYGHVVTYEESPHAHVRTEFAFDIDQLSQARFAPTAYLRSVGMHVSRRLMEQAFYQTYGLKLHSVLGNERAAFRSYESSVRSLLTRVAYAEVLLHRGRFPSDAETPEFQKFKARLEVAATQNHWAAYRQRHFRFSTRALAVLIVILPKVGPLSELAIRGPAPDTEQRYIFSVDTAVDEYTRLLADLSRKGQDDFALPDLDLDTGFRTRPGAYALTDETYATLLHRITRDNVSAHVPSELKQNVLEFFSDPDAAYAVKKHRRAWKQVQANLELLRQRPGA